MINVTRLPGGLTVLTEKLDHACSLTVGLWVKAGARDESPENAGICHFLEHMNFKGTEKRSARELAWALESRGGQINAYTAKEYTTFYCHVLGEDYRLALDVLADLFLHSTYDEGELEKEKKVVLEEIKLYEDSPDELAIDELNRLFWADKGLATPILGTEETVKSFDRRRLMAYREEHYLPEETVLAAVGNLEHEALVEEAQKLFAGYNRKGRIERKDDGGSHGGRILRRKDIEQEHVAIAIPGASLYHPDYYGLVLINEYLGGGASSRLFQTVREEKGLSYSVFSYVNGYRDTGLLGIYAGTGRGLGDQVEELCVREVAAVAEKGLPAGELEQFKIQIKSGMLMGMDSLSGRLARLGRNYLYHQRVVPPEEVVAKVMAVTEEEIREIARKYFREENYGFARVAPPEEE